MSSGQSEYERRAARQRQLELMEASASGVLPTMELDVTEDTGFTSIRQRNQETTRHFLHDEDETDPSRRPSKNTAHAQLFGPRETGMARVNLMDHETGVYRESDDGDINFVDSMFGVRPGYENDVNATDVNIYLGNGTKPTGRATRASGICVNLRKNNAKGRRLRYMVLGLFLFVTVLIVMLLTKQEETHLQEIHYAENTERYNAILKQVTLTGISKPDVFNDENSDEHQALRWVAYSDPARLDPEDPMLIQRYVLAVFYYASYNDFVKDHGEQPALKHGDEQSEGVPVPGFHRRDFWLTEKGVCLWYGIECVERDGKTQYDADANIVHLDMSYNHVYGHLPREFKGLTGMSRLNLAGNQLKGTFPPELGRMFRLKFLDLHDNDLTGQLPAEIGFLESCTELILNNNKFTGTVPIDIERMYNVRKIDLDGNEFSGEFPSIRNLANLDTLLLSNNKFTKRIPSSFTFLTNLSELHLEFNEFTGPIPNDFKNIEKLKVLWLHDNQLTGKIPHGLFESNIGLEQINFEKNQLTGGLPDSIGQLEGLISFKLNDNKLQGPIPEAWTNMKKLRELNMQNNEIKGPLPDSLGTMPHLRELMLDHNDLTGQIPASLGDSDNLETIYLDHNDLTGKVPSEVSKIKGLTTLRLEANAFSGQMPEEVCRLATESNLNYLSVDCGEEVECDCCVCF